MERLPRRTLEILASRFGTLANATRLQILNLLCEREMTVGELLAATGQKQANLSKQLGILLGVGLVHRRTEGVHAFYSITSQSLPLLCEMMHAVVRESEAERSI